MGGYDLLDGSYPDNEILWSDAESDAGDEFQSIGTSGAATSDLEIQADPSDDFVGLEDPGLAEQMAGPSTKEGKERAQSTDWTSVVGDAATIW